MDRYVGWSVVALNAIAVSALAIFIARGESSQTVAAWIQALGSVAAIYWAARIARRQGEDAQRAVAEQQRLHLTGLGSMLGHLLLPLYAADSALKAATDVTTTLAAAKKALGGLEDAVGVAHRIPFHEVPYAQVAHFGLGFSRQLEMAAELVAGIANREQLGEQFFESIQSISECCFRAEYFLENIESAAA